jgi:hypothetical protein
VTLNLKIEILKVFSLEFSMSSTKDNKKEDKGAKEDTGGKPATNK